MTDRTTIPGDGFQRVIGARRGITDPRVLSERLTASQRELTATHRELAALRKAKEGLVEDLGTLNKSLTDLEHDLHIANAELALHERDRDQARYAAVRAGARDPLPLEFHDEHHGIWTPGRPFLTGEHVYEPRTGECYRARPGGAPPGERPRTSPRWQRCRPHGCPPPPVLWSGHHPVGSGAALRQSRAWWDASGKEWELHQLSTEHLLAAIDWLRDNASRIYCGELDSGERRLPCLALAYPSAAVWLSDTPLMRALLAERRSRGLRQPRPPAAMELP